MIRFLSLAALSMAASATAAPQRAPTVRIERAMVDADPAPTKESASGGYARLTSIGRADRLVRLRCECARDVDIHRIIRKPQPNMIGLQSLVLPPNVPVDVAPGSDWHFWVGDLVRPLLAGERVRMVLTFDKAGDVPVDFAIEAKTKEAWAAFDAAGK